MADNRRRPIADFLIFAREQPNVALGWGLALIALLAVVGFGVVKAVGGSGHSSANAGGDGGAQVDGSGDGSSGGAGGSTRTTKASNGGSPNRSGAPSGSNPR